MKFMLMMNGPRNSYEIFGSLSKDELRAHIAFMRDLSKYLRDSGEYVATEGLADPRQARRVKAGPDGAPVTDGVFPESKEFLAGFWIVDVASAERAYAIAAKASSAPGPGGRPINMDIEVREVLAGVPKEYL